MMTHICDECGVEIRLVDGFWVDELFDNFPNMEISPEVAALCESNDFHQPVTK